MTQLHGGSQGCEDCRRGGKLEFDFTFAFQPIVDTRSGTVFAYEALVRGLEGESALSVLSRVNDENRYLFDQACRVKAITLATELGIESKLNINFLPNAVYRPELCIKTTLAAAKRLNFPIERIVFEVTESEKVSDGTHLGNIFQEYKRLGFATAIDDFGAGYAGLNFLADYQPDYLKLDMALIREIDRDAPRQAIVRGILVMCRSLGITVIAEGVETDSEFSWLSSEGVELCQGYLFARPAFQALPGFALPATGQHVLAYTGTS